MSFTVDRRAFLAGAGAAALGVGMGGIGEAQDAGAQELTTYQVGPQIWVRCAGRSFTSYRAHPTQKYPYLYPVAGPATGVSLTTESGDPYPHHRSVLFACDHVNGADYWQEGLERGQIVSRGPRITEAKGAKVVFTDTCDWRVAEGPPDFIDERRYSISAPSPALRFIEANITLTAARDVQITRTNHSLFSVRAAPELSPNGGGTLVDAEGRSGEKATFGQKAAWCTYYGERFGVTEGIALLDHPENPWSPCTWFTRDYGFISPTPMQWLGDDGMHIAEGDSLRLGYLVVAYQGTPDEADLAGVLERWSTAATP